MKAFRFTIKPTKTRPSLIQRIAFFFGTLFATSMRVRFVLDVNGSLMYTTFPVIEGKLRMLGSGTKRGGVELYAQWDLTHIESWKEDWDRHHRQERDLEIHDPCYSETGRMIMRSYLAWNRGPRIVSDGFDARAIQPVQFILIVNLYDRSGQEINSFMQGLKSFLNV